MEAEVMNWISTARKVAPNSVEFCLFLSAYIFMEMFSTVASQKSIQR